MHPDSLNGEYYRLLTGNFFHSNYNHLLLNSGGLLLIWLFHAEHYSWKHYFSVLLLCCVGSSLAALTLTPGSSIIGLSGALHGLIIYGAFRDIQDKQLRQVGILMLIGVTGKVILENTMGISDTSEGLIGMRVAIEAHLFGTVTGIVLGLLSLKLLPNNKGQS